MADIKTLDNLGPDAYNRYIHDTKLLSETDLQKLTLAPDIAKKTEILRTTPFFAELEKLWGLFQNNTTLFSPPKDYFLSTSDVFTTHLVPGINADGLLQQLKNFQETKKLSAEDKQSLNSLQKLLIMLNQLNQIISEIKNRSNEYHRG